MISQLPILIVNAHTRCNCRCGMCDIWKTTGSLDFTVEQLRAQLDDIDRLGVQWVVFTGGEPLMHADLFALTRILRERNIKVTVLSTGVLLERLAAQVAQDVDEVIVSLDGPQAIHDAIRRTPGCFASIERGIRAIRDWRPGFPISARSTVQRANHASLLETIAAAREIGLDSISFLAADVSSHAFGRELVWPAGRQDAVRLTRTETGVLETQIEALLEHPDGFVVDRPQHLRRIVSHFRALLGLEPFAAPRCNAPWVSAVLEPNGDLRPCFFHPVVGSMKEAGLERALNSEAATRFRQTTTVEQDPICQRCVCSLYRG